jgi:CDP-diacylglycerol---glycerol-3-phosphate 3-phosphatidyltransferase
LHDPKPGNDNPADPTIAPRYETLTDRVKQRAYVVIDPAARFLSSRGIHPNVLSFIGFIVASAAGVAVAWGKHPFGGWLFLVSGPFDALDGALARTAGKETRFGAFLDSCLDRFSEAAVLFGLLYWCCRHDHHVLALLCFLAMFGSVMVSYTRARAEGLKMSCKIGLFTRMERFVVMALMLITGQLAIGLSLLAFFTNMTALQRILHVYRQSSDR